MSAPSQPKRIWILPALLLVGAGLLLVGCDQGKPQAGSLLSTPIPTIPTIATSTPTMYPFPPFGISRFEHRTRTPWPIMPPIPTSTMHPVDATRIAEVTSRPLTEVAQNTAYALTPTVPRPTWPLYHTPLPVNLPLGTIEPAYLGKYVCSCRFQNAWRGRLGDDYVIVYAGAWREYPDQGLLMVRTRTANYATGSDWDFYNSPIRAGSLRVTGANGNQITVSSTTGPSFTFDVEARTWISP